jgi:glutamate synthase domain-containing protein 1
MDMPAIVAALARVKARADAKGAKMAVWGAFLTTGQPAAKSIITFDSSSTSAARDLAKLNGPTGGTILTPAIVAAIAATKKVIVSKRIVVVIWDGQTSDEDSLTAAVAGEKQVKVSQILVGADASIFVLATTVFGSHPIADVPGIEKALAQLIG